MIEAAFSLWANSEAMLTDALAMFVDAFTYLLNMLAERCKRHQLFVDESKSINELIRQREIYNLYMELISPILSVFALLGVCFGSLNGSIRFLLHSGRTGMEAPNLTIMCTFASLNLALDIWNMIVFDKDPCNAGNHLIRKVVRNDVIEIVDHEIISTECSTLLNKGCDLVAVEDGVHLTSKRKVNMNLNMVSAYTHIIADTLRSIAMLVTVGLIPIFTSWDPEDADACANTLVSLIIIFSLGPLLSGMIHTWTNLLELRSQPVE